MTIFEELYALATSATLTMIVSADEKTGKMTVNVLPRPKKDADEPALAKALSLTATPQEFDADFLSALQGYREVHQSLAQQAEATREVLEAAKLASVKKAGDAVSKATKPATPARSTPTPAAAPPLTAAGTADDGAENASPAASPAGAPSFDLFG